IYSWNMRSAPSRAVTDSDGKFQVAGLGSALYSVSANAPTYVPELREPLPQPTYYRIGDTVELTLVKGSVITGTVTSALGDPVVQVPVHAILIREMEGQKYAVNAADKVTDDRGVYRFYGLLPGTYLISAGGRGGWSMYPNAYDSHAPTFAPSSNRDSATEIAVRSGEERSGVDIRYLAESGHLVSGTIEGPPAPTGSYGFGNVSLTQVSKGIRMGLLNSVQASDGRSFTFYGVGDGDYELTAMSPSGPSEIAVSDQRAITVRGSDVTGLTLVTKPLGAISGRIVLENSSATECKGKRQPLLAETMVLIKNNSKEPVRIDPRFIWQGRPVSPDKSGEIVFSNLAPGHYRFDAQFSAKYWYLKAISQSTVLGASAVAKLAAGNRPADVARNGISLKHGEKLGSLTLTLAEGAASLHGRIKLGEGESLRAQLYLHLVPSEKESTEDVLRYFAAPVNQDGSFDLGNLPPGRYWAVLRIAEDHEAKATSKLRLPDESPARMKLRREAEAAQTEIEFKPCQNITGYLLSPKPR
ncbi:MAG TPA: carboxypeptidase-like regulatory domain-containing protein, partial [Pyrinomonadaceae bacterium]|nr:carboxypeptidase-like regulatory domain-containing protein [Pyrinomonadaceae bacterium]